MSTIYAKKGFLYYSIRYLDFNGIRKRHQESLNLEDTPGNRRKAKSIKKKKDDEWKFKNFKGFRNLRISQAVDLFLEAKKQDVKDMTYKTYDSSLIPLTKLFGDIYIRDFNQDHVRQLKAKMKGFSKFTIESYFRSMRILFTEMIKRGYITDNIIPRLKAGKKVLRIKSDDLLLKAIESFENPTHIKVMKFLYHSGFRKNELISLQYEDVLWSQGIILVTNNKGNREDEFPLLPELQEILRDGTAGKVFPYRSTYGLNYLAKLLRKKSIKFQDFRYSFASRWAKTLQPIELMKIMRHEDISTTLRFYIDLDINDIAKKMSSQKGSQKADYTGLNEIKTGKGKAKKMAKVLKIA